MGESLFGIHDQAASPDSFRNEFPGTIHPARHPPPTSSQNTARVGRAVRIHPQCRFNRLLFIPPPRRTCPNRPGPIVLEHRRAGTALAEET